MIRCQRQPTNQPRNPQKSHQRRKGELLQNRSYGIGFLTEILIALAAITSARKDKIRF